MIMTFVPIFNVILATDQLAVPVAVPLVPLAVLAHVTLVMPTLSVAVPVSLTLDDLVLYETLAVGVFMVTTGLVVSAV
jgi:hypothetical protein